MTSTPMLSPFRYALLFLATLAAAPGLAQESGKVALTDAFVKAGLASVQSRSAEYLSAVAMDGKRFDASLFSERPALIYIWTGRIEGRADIELVAKARDLVPGLGFLVLSQESLAKVERHAWIGPYAGLICTDSIDAIRSVGKPVAPAWLFVLPGGSIRAIRFGKFNPAAGTGLAALKALSGAFGDKRTTETTSTAQPLTAKDGTIPGTQTGTSSIPEIPVTLNKGVLDTTFASALELSILSELNRARTDPPGYAVFLRQYRSLIRGSLYSPPGQTPISLSEGTLAVDEAIDDLMKRKPLPGFAISRGLSLAAGDHAKSQSGGATGHTGSDGSSPVDRMNRYGTWLRTAGENIAYGGKTGRDIVLQLIIDDGVPSRGHRKNIFEPAFAVVGLGAGPHFAYGVVSVMDFAGGYEER